MSHIWLNTQHSLALSTWTSYVPTQAEASLTEGVIRKCTDRRVVKQYVCLAKQQQLTYPCLPTSLRPLESWTLTRLTAPAISSSRGGFFFLGGGGKQHIFKKKIQKIRNVELFTTPQRRNAHSQSYLNVGVCFGARMHICVFVPKEPRICMQNCATICSSSLFYAAGSSCLKLE